MLSSGHPTEGALEEKNAAVSRGAQAAPLGPLSKCARPFPHSGHRAAPTDQGRGPRPWSPTQGAETGPQTPFLPRALW